MSEPTPDPEEQPEEGGALWTHLALFIATCFTTAWAGARYNNPMADTAALWSQLADGVPFAASLMGILITHEMGHYVLARIHRVDVSLPYFIPLPFIGMIGTLGAVIRMRGEIRDRNALADIGAAGPIAGLVVAVPVLLVGLHLSEVKPLSGGLVEGNSLLYLGLKYLMKGQILPGGGLDVHLHAVALAGWVGLLVTMINLLPIGQLDGGHIAAAYFGDGHDRTAGWLHRGLLPLALGAMAYSAYELSSQAGFSGAVVSYAVMAGLPWLVWWGLLQLMRRATGGRYHPPVAERALTVGRRRLCVGMLLTFLLILKPIPMRVTSVPGGAASQPAASQPAASQPAASRPAG